MVFYNEHDPFAAAWLRELMADDLIAPGIVDERSIEDIAPSELMGYRQCHFFAGIGVWSLALRLAGWPDDRPIWTGSCPCQPFSAAGKGGGLADERHLWPSFAWLIGECRPPIVVGEQVSSDDGLAWLDVVLADLDQAGYACGALDTCAAGFGAPHIRQRLYWMADADRGQRRWLADGEGRECNGHAAGRIEGDGKPAASGVVRGMEHAASGGRGISGDASLARSSGHADSASGPHGGMADAERSPGRSANETLDKWQGRAATQAAKGVNLHQPLHITAQMAGWPTPMAGTPAQKGYNAAGNNDSSRLTVELLSGWPTPTNMDQAGSRGHGYMDDGKPRAATNQRREVLTGHAGTTLTDAAIMCGPARLTACGLLLTGSDAAMESGGQLNPRMSLWLMMGPYAELWFKAGQRIALPKKRRK